MISIDWGSFALVAVVAVVAAVVISAAYSGGVRLLSSARGPEAGSRSGGAMVGAVVCFAIGIAAVLFGLWLAIPQFH